MRQHKILTRTLLILSIINFALAAPVAVRERPEVHLDAIATRNVTAASQKRADSLDEGGSTNVPVPDHAPPPSLDSTNWEELMRMFGMTGQHRYTSPPPPPLSGGPPVSPGSLTGSDHAPPPSLDSTNWEKLMQIFGMTGQHRYTGSPPPPPTPLASGPTFPPPSNPVRPINLNADPIPSPRLSPGPPVSLGSLTGSVHAPPPSLDSTNWEELMQIFGMTGQHRYTGSPLPPPSGGSPVGMGSLTGSDHAPPPSLDSTNWEELMRMFGMTGQHRYTSPPPPPLSGGPPVSPGSLKGSDHAPPPSLDSTNWEELMRMFGMTGQHRYTSPPPPPLSGGPPVSSGSLTGTDRAPPPSLDSTNWEELMRIFGMTGQHRYTGSPLPPPSGGSPVGMGSLTGSDYVPPSPGLPTGSQLPVGSMPVAGSLSPPQPPPPHTSQPGPSDHHFPNPPGFSGDPDTWSTDYRPTLPQSPGVVPETHFLPSLEPLPTEFWDEFLKDKIKRRSSGSDAVNLAQKDPRF